MKVETETIYFNGIQLWHILELRLIWSEVDMAMSMGIKVPLILAAELLHKIRSLRYEL